jgi:5-methylcytosine-specific restriction endonuclease McrA
VVVSTVYYHRGTTAMNRPNEFSWLTQQRALARQKNRCASCGTHIFRLGDAGAAEHEFGEGARAHHKIHIKFGGTDSVDNCVILCQSCHYSVHEGGNFRFGSVVGRESDYPHFRG